MIFGDENTFCDAIAAFVHVLDDCKFLFSIKKNKSAFWLLGTVSSLIHQSTIYIIYI